MLSDRFIRNAKVGLHADADGLYLQVYASGTKAFVRRTQQGGKSKKEVLGHYPAMGLAEAREVLAKIKSGHKSITVNEAFDEYYSLVKASNKEPTLVRRVFDKDILPTIGERDVSSITRRDLTDLFRVVLKRGAPTMANKTMMLTKAFFGYCEQLGWIERNPIDTTRKEVIGGKEKPRDRVLSWSEVWAFLRFLRSGSHDMTPPTRVALYLCLLTGQRATEVLSFKVRPGVKYMAGSAKSTPAGPVDYKVPLTPHVRAAMKMFSPVRGGHCTLSAALRRYGMTFTPHDLRRTMTTRMADLGVMPHVVEKLVNHKMVGMMAVYNHAEYWPERVAAQALWGRKLAELRRQKDAPE